MKSLIEQMAAAPKFERATKTDVHYTGTINGKTWVVPHSFHGSHDVLHGTKVTPMRHAIVTSPVHVQHNNPTLKPEEMARVHQHIKDVHGGQEAAPKHDSFGKLEENMSPEHIHYTIAKAEHPNEFKKDQLLAKAKREKVKAERPMRNGAADRFLRRFGESSEQAAPVKGTPEYQAERDKYRHAALAASRKAATLAFARKHHIIKETMKKPNYADPFAHHQTVIAKKTLRMPDAMVGVMGGPNKDESRKHLKKIGWTDEQIHKHEHGQFAVNEHSGSEKRYNPDGSYRAGIKVMVDGKPGEISHVHHSQEHPKYPHSYKITDTSANDPYKQTRLRGNTFISHHDIKPLNERTLTPAETEKKEELVHHMKKGIQGFKDRYGKDAKSVMYATATKNAKRLAEDQEQLDELSDAAKQFVHHREEHWKHAKLNRHAQDRTAAKFHGNEMQAHFHKMTPSEKFRAHTGSWVSSPSKRLGGGSAKEDKQYVHESFMGTYTRNENANRHTANIVHLAKHFGTPADQAEAKFYHDELKKHGHNKHHEAAYKLHEKLWPYAVAAHHMSESVEQIDELSQSTLRRYIVGAAKSKDKLSNLSHAEAGMKRFGNAEVVDKKNKRRTTGIKKAVGKLHEGEEIMSTKQVVKSVLAEMSTRKHFQQVADLIKANPDAAKRQELANHHAEIFAKQNPRFSHERFHAAAGTQYKG